MVHGILKSDEDLVAHVTRILSNSSLVGALIGVWKRGPILAPIFLCMENWSDSHTNFPNFLYVHERLDIAIHIQFNIFVMAIIIIFNTKNYLFRKTWWSTMDEDFVAK